MDWLMDGCIDWLMDELTVKWIDGWMALDGLIDLETEEDGWCVFLLRKKSCLSCLFIRTPRQMHVENATL